MSMQRDEAEMVRKESLKGNSLPFLYTLCPLSFAINLPEYASSMPSQHHGSQ